jgi:hypothetical protein
MKFIKLLIINHARHLAVDGKAVLSVPVILGNIASRNPSRLISKPNDNPIHSIGQSGVQPVKIFMVIGFITHLMFSSKFGKIS